MLHASCNLLPPSSPWPVSFFFCLVDTHPLELLCSSLHLLSVSPEFKIDADVEFFCLTQWCFKFLVRCSTVGPFSSLNRVLIFTISFGTLNISETISTATVELMA